MILKSTLKKSAQTFHKKNFFGEHFSTKSRLLNPLRSRITIYTDSRDYLVRSDSYGFYEKFDLVRIKKTVIHKYQ